MVPRARVELATHGFSGIAARSNINIISIGGAIAVPSFEKCVGFIFASMSGPVTIGDLRRMNFKMLQAACRSCRRITQFWLSHDRRWRDDLCLADVSERLRCSGCGPAFGTT